MFAIIFANYTKFMTERRGSNRTFDQYVAFYKDKAKGQAGAMSYRASLLDYALGYVNGGDIEEFFEFGASSEPHGFIRKGDQVLGGKGNRTELDRLSALREKVGEPLSF